MRAKGWCWGPPIFPSLEFVCSVGPWQLLLGAGSLHPGAMVAAISGPTDPGTLFREQVLPENSSPFLSFLFLFLWGPKIAPE